MWQTGRRREGRSLAVSSSGKSDLWVCFSDKDTHPSPHPQDLVCPDLPPRDPSAGAELLGLGLQPVNPGPRPAVRSKPSEKGGRHTPAYPKTSTTGLFRSLCLLFPP